MRVPPTSLRYDTLRASGIWEENAATEYMSNTGFIPVVQADTVVQGDEFVKAAVILEIPRIEVRTVAEEVARLHRERG